MRGVPIVAAQRSAACGRTACRREGFYSESWSSVGCASVKVPALGTGGGQARMPFETIAEPSRVDWACRHSWRRLRQARVRAEPEDGDLVAMTLRGDSEAFRDARRAVRPRGLPPRLSDAARRRGSARRDARGLLQGLPQPANLQARSRSFRPGSSRSPTTPAATGSTAASTIANEELPERADAAPGPEQQVIALDEAARLRAAIDALPEKYRTVVTLFHLQGRQYEEIAKRARLADGYGKNTFVSRQGAATQASGRNGGNRIMNMDDDDALERAIFALPLEEPPGRLACLDSACDGLPSGARVFVPRSSRWSARSARSRSGWSCCSCWAAARSSFTRLQPSARRLAQAFSNRDDPGVARRPAARRRCGSRFSPDPNRWRRASHRSARRASR